MCHKQTLNHLSHNHFPSDFWKFLVANFLTKSAQIFGDILSCLEQHLLESNNCCGHFGGNFCSNWATFDSIIWSHWISLIAYRFDAVQLLLRSFALANDHSFLFGKIFSYTRDLTLRDFNENCLWSHALTRYLTVRLISTSINLFQHTFLALKIL